MSIAVAWLVRLGARAALMAALVLVLVLAPVPTVLAQSGEKPGQSLRVVTRVLPPLVVEQPGGRLSGFSIELWERISERLKIKSSYHIAPNIGALLGDVRSGKADVGVAAISITAAREAEFDFTHPILNAGLQIMVRGRGQESQSSPFWDLMSLLF